MSNYIALLLLTPIIIASTLIKRNKLFVIVNLTCIILLVIYYGIMIYVEYQHTVDSLYMHTTEDGDFVVEWMMEGARPKFNNIIYHLSAMTTLLVINTSIFARKLLRVNPSDGSRKNETQN